MSEQLTFPAVADSLGNETLHEHAAAEVARSLFGTAAKDDALMALSYAAHAITKLDDDGRTRAYALLRMIARDWPHSVERGIDKAINERVPF